MNALQGAGQFGILFRRQKSTSDTRVACAAFPYSVHLPNSVGKQPLRQPTSYLHPILLLIHSWPPSSPELQLPPVGQQSDSQRVLGGEAEKGRPLTAHSSTSPLKHFNFFQRGSLRLEGGGEDGMEGSLYIAAVRQKSE